MDANLWTRNKLGESRNCRTSNCQDYKKETTHTFPTHCMHHPPGKMNGRKKTVASGRRKSTMPSTKQMWHNSGQRHNTNKKEENRVESRHHTKTSKKYSRKKQQNDSPLKERTTMLSNYCQMHQKHFLAKSIQSPHKKQPFYRNGWRKTLTSNSLENWSLLMPHPLFSSKRKMKILESSKITGN